MIRVEKVSRNYKTGETVVRALKQVSLDVNDGEFLSIAGPSGSGKTTLLNLIGCIDAIDEGEIFINNVPISDMNKVQKTDFRRNNLGFIFQTYNLIPVLSAYENVSFVLSLLDVPAQEIKDRTYAVLKEVGLEGMENRRPNRLSGGQQQRIAIARALIKQPQIILADEPTANLDSKTGEEILKLMKRMNEKYGTTFIFSTHDKMVMEYASRLVGLHDGMIVSDERRQQ
ncbi:ABC transporter ATP-binding protein [Sphaerochaeta sp.]|jgi:putative ABC transport system ATP-binding protein|uniref:ABC transporter ATP-binding protein n=1 Tax=Sphaerochaeta sp. TaxID=1972642 RepID=UPI002FC8AA67